MNTVTVDGLSRLECALLATIATLSSLKTKGMVEGGSYEIGPNGLAAVERLKAAGFDFNPGELEQALAYLQRDACRA